MPTIERKPEPELPKGSGGEDGLVTLWKRRLHLAERKLRKQGGDPKNGSWRGLIKFFEGDQWPEGRGGKEETFHRVTANQVKSNIDSIRPQLYFQNPKVRIQVKNPSLARQDIPEMDPQTGQPMMRADPLTGQPAPVIRIPRRTPIAVIGGQIVDAQEQVELLESIDNYYLEEMGAKKKLRRQINDALVLPYAVNKLEWVIETETIEEPEIDPATLKDTGKTKKVERIVAQYPRMSRIKPWCFIWDVELDEFDHAQAKWVAEIKYLSKEEIENDPYLKVNFKEIGEPSVFLGEDKVDDEQDEKSEDFARYKVFEIHDLRGQRLMVWVEGSRKMNRDEENPYRNVEGGIFDVLGFDETIDDSFPIPIPQQIKSKAEAYNFILSYAVNHAARANRKYKTQRGSMKPEELEKWEKGADMTTIEVEAMNMGPEPIKDAPISIDIYKIGDTLKREMTEAIGVSAYGRSTREPGVDTAFEANLIQGGSDVKIQEKRDIVREHVKSIVRKLNQILKEFADTETVTQITGERGKRWVAWSAADIKGEFVEDVDIYSSLPYSKMEERKQAMEMYSLAAQDPYMDPLKLRAQVIKMMDWPEDLLKSPAQIASEQQAAAAQAQQAAGTGQQLEANRRNQSKTLRPTDGQVRRRPDMVADIMGSARR